jgi:hypothetical protein
MKTFILSLTLLLISIPMKASAQLMTISSDIDNVVSEMTVNKNVQGDLHSLRIISRSGTTVTKEIIIPFHELQRSTPVVLKDDLSVVSLRTLHSFDHRFGGGMEMRYLANGLTKSYSTLNFDLLKNGSEWEAFQNNKKLTRMVIKGRKVMGKVVGISHIDLL